jgi:transcriptional regulator with XRE-family HTH domain
MRAATRWVIPTLGSVKTDADLKDRLSFAIFWAMWKRNVSPPRLAKAIDKSPDTIRRWRDGETAPSVLDVAPLARALGVRPEYFSDPPEVPDYPFDSYKVRAAEFVVMEEVDRYFRPFEEMPPPRPKGGARSRRSRPRTIAPAEGDQEQP